MNNTEKFFLFLIKLIFIVPILLDLYITLTLLSSLLQWYFPVGFFSFSVNYFLFALGATFFTYVFFLIRSLLSLITRKNRILTFLDRIYFQNKKLIITSIILTGSTLIPFSLNTFFPSFFFFLSQHFIDINSGYFYLLIKLTSILAMILALKVFKNFRLRKIFSFVFVVLLLSYFTFLLYGIYDSSQPHQYFTFPLDDKSGRYLINYDGDYWLTYYEVSKSCISQSHGQNVCKEILIKKGNTSITETPFDLKPYIDVPVHVTGEFIKIYGPVGGDSKKFCIGSGLLKKCAVSTGPGTWYASPLKIRSISVDK